MKRLGVIAIVVVGVVVAHRSAILVHQHLYGEAPPQDGPARAEPARSPLVVPAGELNLGRVYETKDLEHHLHVTNNGDAPARIRRFEMTCDCASISPNADVVLQPGETKPFTLKLKLLSEKPNITAAGETRQIEIIAVFSDGAKTQDGVEKPKRTRWRLTGVVVPTIRAVPSVVRLGVRSHLEQLFEKSVAIEAAAEIQRLESEAPPAWTVAISRDAARSAPTGFRVTIRSKDAPAIRQFKDVIRLTPVTGDGRRLPPKELTVEGEIVHDIAAHPRDIRFGRRLGGTTAEEAIRLLSLTNRRFRVIRVDANDGGLAVSAVPSEDLTFSVRQRFAELGDRQNLATFTVVDEEGKESQVVVPVRYFGVANP